MSLLERMRGDREGWYKVSDLAVGAEIAVPSERPRADIDGSIESPGIFWDEIVSITHIGREQVYDIEVEGTHNFVGNDIFAHNTYLLSADPTTNIVSMGGPVGIGTTTPSAALSVQGVSGISDLFNIASSTGESMFYVNSNGSVGIGTTTPNHTLTVAGDIGAIAFVNTSTRSAKTDINYVTASTTDDMLNQLVQLKVATYLYKIEPQQDPLRLGFIAEDAQTIAPEILSPDGKGVDLYKLATFNIAATQALAARVDAENVRLTSLEARVTALENGSITSASGSPLSLGTSSLASALASFGAYIQKGIAQFGTLVADRFVAATNSAGTSSAGTVTILAGNTVAQVANAYVTPGTKIFVTFTASTTGAWYISDKQNGSFTLKLEQPQASNVSFDYFLVQTEGQIATSTPVTGGSQNSGSQTSGTSSTAAITLLGDNPMHVSVGSVFADPGVVVASGAPVTTFINGVEQVVSTTTITTSSPTTYIITYRAIDAAGNTATAMRSVIVGNPDGTVSTGAASGASGGSSATTTTATASTTAASADTTPPVVTLNGAAAMQLTVGDAFTDPGATATDNVDGDLTAKIVETGSVDTTTVGSYTLTYSATDAAGNTGSASRLVTVLAAPAAGAATSTASTTTTTTTATTTSST